MTERKMNPGPTQSGDGDPTGSLTHGNKMSVNDPRSHTIYTAPTREMGLQNILDGLKITRTHGMNDVEALTAAIAFENESQGS